MTKKEAVIKYIKEMNTDMLSIILEDDRLYMGATQTMFLKKLEAIFKYYKDNNVFEFDKIVPGIVTCTCHPGTPGLSFVVDVNTMTDIIVTYHLDLTINVAEDGTIDIDNAHQLETNEVVENPCSDRISFYIEELAHFTPSPLYLSLKERIADAYASFDSFKSNVTLLEDFGNWYTKTDLIFKEKGEVSPLVYKMMSKFCSFRSTPSGVFDIIKQHANAKKALQAYNEIKESDDTMLIAWVIEYDSLLYMTPDFSFTDDWKETSLIVNEKDGNIVIDASKYMESLLFIDIHENTYFSLYNKYECTEDDFKAAGIPNNYSLEGFMEVREKLKV